MATTTASPTTPAEKHPGAMSFDEAMARYDGQWVVLHVLEQDAAHTPAVVEVLASAPTEPGAWATLGPLLDSTEKPRFPYYLAFAGPRIRTGEELRAVIAAGERDDLEPNDWR